MLILLQCNLIDRLHFRSPLVVLSQPIGLELLRKRPWCLPVQDHDTWQQQRASAAADDEVKISMCGLLPDLNPHRSSLVQVQDQVSIERNQNMQCIQIWDLQKPLFAGTEIILGWKSHDSNQTSAFTLNVCAFEVKTDCRLQQWHE
jgi:hypothetical protein